jgi:membrane protein required for beta-lactamase induction
MQSSHFTENDRQVLNTLSSKVQQLEITVATETVRSRSTEKTLAEVRLWLAKIFYLLLTGFVTGTITFLFAHHIK